MTMEFDDQLKSRLLAFQKAHGLVEDGAAGSETWRKLVDVGYARPAGAVQAMAGVHSPASSVHGGIPFYINPDVFDFKPGPRGSNWQKTGCVEIVFGYGSPFLPMTKIRVGVVVEAPLTLRDGKEISVREAQLDSANAATAAAGIIKGMLDSHAIILDEVQGRFVGFMYGAIKSLGMGYRVRGCYPGGRNAGSGPDDVAES